MSSGLHLETPPRRAIKGRVGVAILLVVSLIFTGVARDWAVSNRESIRDKDRVAGVSHAGSDASLNAMPSFATALLLGGLRGPLVMLLWTSSETQKQEHDLQDFDTKVEWIRLLQPEFDTVHLFQIWNKAYNISVQMASLRNKYVTILDAIDYGQKVDQERPDDISIITAIGQVYGDKLGSSGEYPYYRPRVRRETQTLTRVTFPASRENEFRAVAPTIGWIEDEAPLIPNEKAGIIQVLLEKRRADELKANFAGPDVLMAPEGRRELKKNGPTWRLVRLDPILDEDGNILPSLLVQRYPTPANVAPDQWYDGSPLQFLKKYQPFPYGVSSLALAYNEYKRAQMLQALWDQHHIQSGDTVVDARPGLTLKVWGKDELERGRRFELRTLNREVPDMIEPSELETVGINVLQTKVKDEGSRIAAEYSYDMGARVFGDAYKELYRHIQAYPAGDQTYFFHVDECLSGKPLLEADRNFLKALDATGEARTALLRAATDEYIAAEKRYAVTVLKYYIDDVVARLTYPRDPATGQRYTRSTIESSDPSTYVETMNRAMQATEAMILDPVTHEYAPGLDQYKIDRDDQMCHLERIQKRLLTIQELQQAGATTQ